jgi:hypothetical protein
MEKKVGTFASATSMASDVNAVPPPLCMKPQLIRALLDGHEWAGTVTDLAASLGQFSGTTAPSATRLAIWLRRLEPTLWWDHRVRVRFSRTGKCRRVHLSLRDSTTGSSVVTGISENLLG